MHARIYQIMSKPVPKGYYLTEFDFIDHSFVGEIADYVNGGLDRTHEFEVFGEYIQWALDADFNMADASFSIPQSGKGKYFKSAFEKFTKAANKLSKVDFCAFVNNDGVGGLIYTLKDSFSEKFADYVSSEEFDTMTFDDFVRCAEPGTRYYVGSILDYHF